MSRCGAVSFTVVLLVALGATSCNGPADAGPRGGGRGGSPAGAKQERRFPVEVQPVQARSVETMVPAVGSVDAFEIVQITARVAGAVERVRFSEGDEVQPSTVLVEIEPRRFRLAVAAARAALAQAEASLADATEGVGRRERVNRDSPGLVRGEELESYRTRQQVARAAVAESRVALERAQLDASEARVRASVGGRIQTRTVQTGQWVQPGTVLATLVRRDPLLLRFSVAEVDAPRLQAGSSATFRVGGEDRVFTATITNVGAAADPDSRMVPVTARVDDSTDAALRPGAFADVTVPVGVRADAPVVPQTAIRPSERGFVAFVIEGEVARERVLDLGLRTASGEVEVRSGVRVGERLVVRGAEALRDGAQVRVAGGPGAAP